MRLRLATLASIASVAFVCLSLLWLSVAQSQNIIGGGVYGDVKVGGGPPPSYTGPGDIVSGAQGFWGTQAYNAAYASAGGLAVNVCLPGNLSCTDLVFGSNGNVVDGLVGGSHCSAVACTVQIYYDQTGNGNHIEQATVSARATLVFSAGVATSTCGSGATNSACSYGTLNPASLSQPFTVSYVFNNTYLGTQNTLLGCNHEAMELGYNTSSANQIFLYEGASIPVATVSDGSFHSVQGVFDDVTPTTNIYVDGTSNPTSLGSTAGCSDQLSLWQYQAGGFNVNGKLGSLGTWPVTFNSTQASAMSANNHTNWGF